MLSTVFRLSCVVALFSLTTSANASEFGCKVLLCMANPQSNGGPRGIEECVPTINELHKQLSRGKPFPSCDNSDGNDSSQNFARQSFDYYDPCPSGTQAVQSGTVVAQGQHKTGTSIKWADRYAFDLSGDWAISHTRTMANPTDLGVRACVGQKKGTFYESETPIQVYDQVIWQAPKSTPYAIDV